MTEVYEGFVGRFADSRDIDAVYSFYDKPDRPSSVYLRRREVIEEQVRSGLFFIVTQDSEDGESDRIVAASTAYPLANGKVIDCTTKRGAVFERGVVFEVGSVLKDLNAPPGFFHTLLFAAPMMEVFRRTGHDLPRVDLVVADVQPQLQGNIARLTGTEGTGSPLSWVQTKAAEELVQAFRSTVDPTDANVEKEKLFFRAPVAGLPAVAEYFLDAFHHSRVLNRSGDVLHINLSGLPFLSLCGAIKADRQPFNVSSPCTSWYEVARQTSAGAMSRAPAKAHRPSVPSNGTPLAGFGLGQAAA